MKGWIRLPGWGQVSAQDANSWVASKLGMAIW